MYSKSAKAAYTVEAVASTKITLSTYSADLGDMLIGDHLTVTGKPDIVNTGLGPHPIVAKIDQDQLADLRRRDLDDNAGQ